MTESGPTPHYSRGTGYHAFRGPRPVAWGQRSFSDADWECSHLNFHNYSYHFYQKDIMGLFPSPAIFHMHCTRKLTTAGISGGPGPVGDFLSDAGFLNLENFQPLARFKVRKLQ